MPLLRGICVMGCVILCGTGLLEAATINASGQKGVVRTISAKTMGKTKLNFGMGINIFQSNTFIDDAWDLTQDPPKPINSSSPNWDAARMLSSDVFFGMGLASFWDMGISLPLYYDWLGFNNLQDGGIGDLEISTKFLYPPMSTRFFYQGFFASATIPTGMKTSGFFSRHSYYIDGSDTNPATRFYTAEDATFKGLFLLTFDISTLAPKVPLQVHLNLGGVITSSMRAQRNTAIGSIAVEYTPADIITLFTELHSEARWDNLSSSVDPSRDPLLISPGLRLTTPGGVYFNFNMDFSLSTDARSTRLNWKPESGRAKGYSYSTGIQPGYGVQFMAGWSGFLVTPDDDKDGIPNDQDRCPKEKEDFDKFQDDDGCPDIDNDNDGVPDSLDKCPNKPEDKDGFQDTDGCPDLDNDGDGIPDERDQCPGKAEDFDGFEDHDGCPDIDNDQDGVPDLKDKCLNVPGLPQNNGCPPDTVKPPAPVKKEIDFPKQRVLFGVEFRKATAELTFESYQFLEPIILKLRENPEVEIELHGHTDAIGNFTQNMQLSQMRAEAVRQYCISKGIRQDRIKAVGFGSTSPIADNKTADGRAQNRRIEMIRVK